uniref:Uncharacterized protein n=1 Tax=Arundo donax TaxID=35708 RepID=A0A0A9FIA8_ARUDO
MPNTSSSILILVHCL